MGTADEPMPAPTPRNPLEPASKPSDKTPKIEEVEELSPRAPLFEDAYYRETAAKWKIIEPRHKKLSNDFRKWLRNQHGVDAIQERNQVDVRFTFEKRTVMAELKICYGVGST